jgi:ribosomal protein L16/L10AE
VLVLVLVLLLLLGGSATADSSLRPGTPPLPSRSWEKENVSSEALEAARIAANK